MFGIIVQMTFEEAITIFCKNNNIRSIYTELGHELSKLEIIDNEWYISKQKKSLNKYVLNWCSVYVENLY